jgi:hypothetical protein
MEFPTRSHSFGCWQYESPALNCVLGARLLISPWKIWPLAPSPAPPAVSNARERSLSAPAATPRAARGICRERRINESGIEQTVVAFDVTLKMPTSQQGTAACCPPLKAGASLGRAGVFEETPHASGLAAGFFFSVEPVRRDPNCFGVEDRHTYLSQASLIPSPVPPVGRGFFSFFEAPAARCTASPRAARAYRVASVRQTP